MADSLRPCGQWLPGSSVHGIFQARVPEWIAIVFSTKAQKLGLKNALPALDLPSHLKDPDNTPLSPAVSQAPHCQPLVNPSFAGTSELTDGF